jgi:hypothetical protein
VTRLSLKRGSPFSPAWTPPYAPSSYSASPRVKHISFATRAAAHLTTRSDPSLSRGTNSVSKRGAVALFDEGARCAPSPVVAGSDCSPDFVERRGEVSLRVGFGSEFLVAAAKVLDERVTVDDHLRGLR